MRPLFLFLAFAACNPDAPGDTLDTGTNGDPDSDTAGDTDPDTDPDTEPFEPHAGIGELSGDCGLLDHDVLVSEHPTTYGSEITLPSGFDDDDLSAGGQAMVDAGNLNNSSLYSEVFSYEVLYRCEDAALLLTEGEVRYTNPNGKKTDLVIEVDDLRIGMSVVRAVGWPRADPWTAEDALPLVEGKLADILLSSDNVTAEDAWTKQILHIIAYSPEHAVSVRSALQQIDDDVRGDTIVWVTATNGEDGFIYGD